MGFELTREQRSLVNFFAFAEGGGSLNHSQLGTGKTAQGVALAETLAAESTLIVGPLHVLSGWERHVEMIAGQEVRFIDSKKAGKFALKDLLLNKPGYYFIGRERFRLSDWSNICTDMLLFDESHAAQNKDSRMFQAMESTKHVGYKHFLSATPFGSTFAGGRGGRKTYPLVLWITLWKTSLVDQKLVMPHPFVDPKTCRPGDLKAS